ncbi:MAG TPA: phage protein [bacterium]|nr:phage protein [bacterium]
MGQVKTYDPAQTHLIVGGFLIGGYAPGTMIEVEMDEDAWAKTIGSTGEGVRVKTHNDGAQIRCNLLQSSASNDVLSGFALADKLSNSGAVPVELRDGSGRSLYFCETAWPMRMPTSGFGNEASNREWVLDTNELDVFVGGI